MWSPVNPPGTRQYFSRAWTASHPHSRYLGSFVSRHITKYDSKVWKKNIFTSEFGERPLFVPSKSREKERIEYFSFHYRSRKHPEINAETFLSASPFLCSLHRFERNARFKTTYARFRVSLPLCFSFSLPLFSFNDTHSRTKSRRTEQVFTSELLVSIVFRAKMDRDFTSR